MTHDPWTLFASLSCPSCPSCHVVGKVVRFEREDGGYDCWRKDIERRTVAKSFDLSKLKKTSSSWVMPQRSKVLPTGDVVADLGGSATIQFRDNSDPPWTSFLYDSDSGARVICIGYRTKQYHWNLATDEVTEK